MNRPAIVLAAGVAAFLLGPAAAFACAPAPEHHPKPPHVVESHPPRHECYPGDEDKACPKPTDDEHKPKPHPTPTKTDDDKDHHPKPTHTHTTEPPEPTSSAPTTEPPTSSAPPTSDDTSSNPPTTTESTTPAPSTSAPGGVLDCNTNEELFPGITPCAYSIPFASFPDCATPVMTVYLPDYFPHVHYLVGGRDETGQTLTLQPGQATPEITVTVDQGYSIVFTDQMPGSYVFTDTPVTGCPTSSSPAPTPAGTSPAAHTTAPAAAKSTPAAPTHPDGPAAPAAPAMTPAASSGPLAFTGAHPIEAGLVGLGAVALGAGLVFGATRVRRTRPH